MFKTQSSKNSIILAVLCSLTLGAAVVISGCKDKNTTAEAKTTRSEKKAQKEDEKEKEEKKKDSKKAEASKEDKDYCGELKDALCSQVSPDTCEMVTARAKKFPAKRCVEMLKHIPEIVKDLKKQEEAKKPLSEENQKLIAAGDGPSFGNKDSVVTIVEFSDFECPFCSKAGAATSELKKKYGDKIRVVFRHFPLSFHKNAHLAAQATLSAHAQGKFWEYHDVLFKNQRALGRPELEKYAEELKLDMKAFKADLDSGKYKAAVDADIALGGKVFVGGTPTMFINGERAKNPGDADVISAQIDKILAK